MFYDKDKEDLYRVLEAKEKRAERQIKLINLYKCSLVSFTLSIPGKDKVNDVFKKVFLSGISEIEKVLINNKLGVLYKEKRAGAAGLEAFICSKGDGICIKKLMIDIEENHKYGRIFDIDVYNRNGVQITRGDLGYKMRRCLICNNDAAVCVRQKSHSLEELFAKIYDIINDKE